MLWHAINNDTLRGSRLKLEQKHEERFGENDGMGRNMEL